MIKNIDGLIKYTNMVAEQFPVIKDEVRITSPGCSFSEIEKIADKLPNIPTSYTDVASFICLSGISIGQLGLWPRPFGNSLVDAIITANCDNRNPHLNIYKAHGLIEVARLEANPICIADLKQNERSGQVYMVNVAADPDPFIIFLAYNYTDMLLLAANVHSICLENEDEPSTGLEKIRECLFAFGLGSSEQSFWLNLAEETF
ncbi:hypothetical protein [Vreelandella sp. GE22]